MSRRRGLLSSDLVVLILIPASARTASNPSSVRSSSAFGNFATPVHRSEYPNGCRIRDVTNSEKHPRIDGRKEKQKKPNVFQAAPSSSLENAKISGELPPESFPSTFKLRQPVLRVVPINYQESYRELRNVDDQYYSKKKKRKTEQEKLIASLMVTELPHVDGAFKRSTNIRYRNLNEDKLLDNLFDSKMGKPKRSSGKKVYCVGEIPEVVMPERTPEKETNAEVKERSENGVADSKGETSEIQRLGLKNATEHKKKRKTEKEKLIENLSAIERIHADGAFKRNASYDVNGKGGNSSDSNVFSAVKFLGVDEDIESLILGKTVSEAT